MFVIPCGEMVVVAAFIGGLAGLLFPAVEAARQTNRTGPMFPNLMWLHERTFPLPIAVFAVASSFVTYIAFGSLRAFAPESVVRYFPWWKAKQIQR